MFVEALGSAPDSFSLSFSFAPTGILAEWSWVEADCLFNKSGARGGIPASVSDPYWTPSIGKQEVAGV